MPIPSISVVVPSFNRRPTLEASLDRLTADPATHEVIVVDDGSTDGTLEWLRARATTDPLLRLLEQRGRGPAEARATGTRAATAEHVLVLDDDVVPSVGLVTAHAVAGAGRDDVIVVGYTPSVLGPSRRPGDTAEIAYARDYEQHCRRWEAGQPVLDRLWAGNFSMATRRANEVGFVSNDYEERHAVHEDRDFGLRCAAAGLVGEFHRELGGAHHYRRAVARAALDARRRSGGLVRLHEAHAATLGPFDEQTYRVPTYARPLVSVLRRGRVGLRTSALLVRSVEAASRLRAHRAADLLFKAMRRHAEHVGLATERVRDRA